MKHHKKKRTLGRKYGQRVALLRSLARSLILAGGITTTIARAKELRPFVEKLISASKQNTTASRRAVSSRMGGSPDTVLKLHQTIAPGFKERVGGYTRIIRLGRVGKRAIESARIELVK
ncbi:50S ribosomal protein L17 [Candidatus Kaiserbacteria bacterium RIFCSPHIGHO2_02_FULL_49_16]|uniref:50S ribosomal protein L17 n=1 Tax=Candidatus Kaiserbacteria bacterium RIFCSPHIGHO2_02_FULL_49_16 TaxID=1798490 RepID=A0A1F6DHV0_9BACT|nr:MAG: 50S ribosomal protein L17 [Candidatus Kaiserbacteria bacterium RIFCSPHIGHO2_02_FULL_49_16]